LLRYDSTAATITSDAGALLLREVASAHSLFEDFARCFVDGRDQRYTEHTVQGLVSQRVYGICLGYEDLNDHDRLRLDPLLATVCGKEDAEGECRRVERDKGKAFAGKSTLQRLEPWGDEVGDSERYKKIVYDAGTIERYFVDVFLKTYGEKPQEIILDVDATDDPIHGE
jgi:hypothetical protein